MNESTLKKKQIEIGRERRGCPGGPTLVANTYGNEKEETRLTSIALAGRPSARNGVNGLQEGNTTLNSEEEGRQWHRGRIGSDCKNKVPLIVCTPPLGLFDRHANIASIAFTPPLELFDRHANITTTASVHFR